MQTKTLIQSSANVLKVTNLVKGNVVKIVEHSAYSTDIFFGIVIDILNSGTKTFLQVLQYNTKYGELKGELKTYSGDKDLSLFPATIDEVKENLSSSVKRLEKEIEEEEKKVLEKKQLLAKAIEFSSGEMSKQLTNTSFEEITQEEHNKQIAEKKALIEEIS